MEISQNSTVLVMPYLIGYVYLPDPNFGYSVNPIVYNNAFATPTLIPNNNTVVANNRNNCKFLRSASEPLSFVGLGKNQITSEDLQTIAAHLSGHHPHQHQKLERLPSNASEPDRLVQSRSGSFSSGSSGNNNGPGSPPIPAQVTSSSRYKTELCRPYEENGVCKYGEKCQFAHGVDELRTLQRHPKYKTELCRTFHTTGFCPYGPRCHFIHNSEDQIKPKAPRQRANTFGSTGEVVLSPPASDEDSSPFFEERFQFPMPDNMAYSFGSSGSSSGGDCSPPPSYNLGTGRRPSTGLFNGLIPDLYDFPSAYDKNASYINSNLGRLSPEYGDLHSSTPTTCSKTVQDQMSRLSFFNSMVGLIN